MTVSYKDFANDKITEKTTFYCLPPKIYTSRGAVLCIAFIPSTVTVKQSLRTGYVSHITGNLPDGKTYEGIQKARFAVIATARYEAGSNPCAYTGLLHCVRNDGAAWLFESLFFKNIFNSGKNIFGGGE
jgi:hypothetical protein